MPDYWYHKEVWCPLLTSDPSPTWSPDGSEIVYATNLSGNWEISIMEANGNNPVVITDEYGSDHQPDWIEIDKPDNFLEICETVLAKGDLKTQYQVQTLTVKNGNAPFKWSVTKNSLPVGLKLTADKDTSIAHISGIPKKSGTYSFRVQVVDGANNIAQRDFSIVVNSLVKLLTPKIPNGEVGADFPEWIPCASGGSGNFTWTISSGVLPEGLNLDNLTGAITGLPVQSGNYKFTLTVKDDLGCSKSKSLTLKILDLLEIVTITLPSDDVGIPYKKTTLKAVGGNKKYTWSYTGSLPPGFTLSNKGKISGIPTEGSSGVYTFTAHVSDGICETNKTLSITINDLISIPDLPAGNVGKEYIQKLSPCGGSGVYKIKVIGVLPSWLQFNSKNFILSGTPLSEGTYNINFQITDSLKYKKIFTVCIKIISK